MRQRLGQHFLTNRSVIKKIISALALEEGETVIEIGPGHGELTTALLQEKVQICAIERDPSLVVLLQKNLTNTGLTVSEGDALNLLPSVAKGLSSRKYKLVGNIPYYITGHLLRTISELPTKPEITVLMVQREVAERIAAQPPDMNRLSASIQYWAETKIIARLGKEDFSPPPEVDSAVIKLIKKSRKTKKDEALVADEDYYSAMRILFQQPRKTILNNLSKGLPAISKQYIESALKKISVAAGIRPQELSVHTIELIAREFISKQNNITARKEGRSR